MSQTNHLYLLTGSNIEPRFQYLQEAKQLIEKDIGRIEKESRIYESKPWGFDSSENFLNQVMLVFTELPPYSVLKRILQIEKSMGRVRNSDRYDSRIIDIDILYYNNECINQPGLVIPHPRLHQRRFTLMPLVEIAGSKMHPVLNMDNSELLSQCEDNSVVKEFEEESE